MADSPAPSAPLAPSGPARRQPPAAEVGPWPGFAVAADAVVSDLHRRFGLGLWMVTHVDDDRQVVVASAGPWGGLASPGVAFSWAQSFCLRMVTHDGPVAEPDVQRSPGYGPIAVGSLARVHAYVGVPLLSGEGRLFGTLCAFAGAPQPKTMSTMLEPATLLGRLLSTLVAGEQFAADRSQEAAAAYALAEQDPITGLRNRRGWEAALLLEEQRSRWYGAPVGVLSLGLTSAPGMATGIGGPAGDHLGDATLEACATVLQSIRRPGDTLCRVVAGEFAVLAVECDVICMRALAAQLRVRLRSAGLAASVGIAGRQPQETLEQAWRRAIDDMGRDRRRRYPPAAG